MHAVLLSWFVFPCGSSDVGFPLDYLSTDLLRYGLAAMVYPLYRLLIPKLYIRFLWLRLWSTFLRFSSLLGLFFGSDR